MEWLKTSGFNLMSWRHLRGWFEAPENPGYWPSGPTIVCISATHRRAWGHHLCDAQGPPIPREAGQHCESQVLWIQHFQHHSALTAWWKAPWFGSEPKHHSLNNRRCHWPSTPKVVASNWAHWCPQERTEEALLSEKTDASVWATSHWESFTSQR